MAKPQEDSRDELVENVQKLAQPIVELMLNAEITGKWGIIKEGVNKALAITAIERTNGNQSHAALMSCMNRATLRGILKKAGLL